jgi:hypothetical protein
VRNLYIDFDGVILDTISIMYKDAEKEKINLNDVETCREFFLKYDWNKLLEEADVLADSINAIKKLNESGKYIIMILTHVYGSKETDAKMNFLLKYLPGIPMVPVPKGTKKTDLVGADGVKGAILVDDYKNNLRDWQEAGGIAYRFCITETDEEFINIDSLYYLLEQDIDSNIELCSLESL